MPKYKNATIYLLEDINDNRYIGSTGEQKLENRLSTHRRDQTEHLFGIRNRNCSSMKLDLFHTVIIPLKVVENNLETRRKWESYYINEVYPECVNYCRFHSTDKKYYELNKENIKKRNNEWRKNNPEKVKESRRKYYEKNKEKIREYKKQWRLKNNLKNKL